MIHKVKTYTVEGLLGHEITIEVASNKSLPTIEIIGLPDLMIKESKERIRSALRNSGIEIPPRKYILNLSPSDIRKSGTAFDLPMAMGLLASIQQGSIQHEDILLNSLFFGELSLDGGLKRVDGLLPMVISAKKSGYSQIFIPYENLGEIEYISGLSICPVKHFREISDYFVSGIPINFIKEHKSIENIAYLDKISHFNFKDIQGLSIAKRALCIAASGLHNTLLVGSPGCGKTLLAKALPSIMPPLHPDEIIEISQIYSVAGKLTHEYPLVLHRPYRCVHHTASKIALVGGGSNLRPGEVSLSHRGILFLDEITEFPRENIEVLRQPLEDKTIHISRVSGNVSYPADFMLVAAMNPCKCGYYNDKEHNCSCTEIEIKRYQQKISGPLLDRIDMILEIQKEKLEILLDKRDNSESSELLKEKVVRSRHIQQQRYANLPIHCNAQLDSKLIKQFITLSTEAENFLHQAHSKLKLSNRAVHRILKLARTIADFSGHKEVNLVHLSESLQYRNKNILTNEL